MVVAGVMDHRGGIPTMAGDGIARGTDGMTRGTDMDPVMDTDPVGDIILRITHRTQAIHVMDAEALDMPMVVLTGRVVLQFQEAD